ncbi:hypothetical protein Tco_0223599 [Tanacetum coccineum]
MRIDELHKFSDGTLNDVRTALNDLLKGIRMKYLPQTIWRQSDRDKSAAMIQAIDKQLKTRRIMRSLEKFVGGRSYEEHPSDIITMKMEIKLEPTLNKLMGKFDESDTHVLERFDTSAGNSVKEILLKLNLPDHSWDKLSLESYKAKCEKIIQVKQRMQAARDRQKSYADLKRKPMEFEVGDKVMLKVSPWKGVVRFGKRGKLNPRFVGPFKVIKRVGDVAYKLELPEELSRVHNTFHVSNLKKCHADEPLAVPLDGLHFDDKLQFVEEPIEITDREVKRLKRSRIPLVKVRWNSKRGPEFTWEREDQFQKKYPHLFSRTGPSSNAAS